MTHATHPQTDYVTVSEVAQALDLSRMTVYRMCQDGTLTHIRTGRAGRTIRILRTSVEEHMRPVAPPAPANIPGQTVIDA